MNQTISIDGKIFKQFRDTQYYCDDLGNIYSNFSKRILKPMLRGPKNKKYHYVDINFGEGQKHCMVHRIVYETWKGEIPKDLYVLHKDDNSLNNAVENLYLGTQKENIADCKNNNHRVGHTWILTLYDKKEKQKVTFCPARDFIQYSGHTSANGSVKRMFTRNWFKQRYEIIDYYPCENLSVKEGVTTNPDECKDVGQILSLVEAHGTTFCVVKRQSNYGE